MLGPPVDRHKDYERGLKDCIGDGHTAEMASRRQGLQLETKKRDGLEPPSNRKRRGSLHGRVAKTEVVGGSHLVLVDDCRSDSSLRHSQARVRTTRGPLEE